MINMFNIFGKVKELQEKLKETEQNLKTKEVTAESGAGVVRVTVNGERQVTTIEIDPSLFDEKDRDMLKDLIIAATNKAMADIGQVIKEEMAKASQGILPEIPGFDPGSFLK